MKCGKSFVRNTRVLKTIYWYGMYLYNNFSDENEKLRLHNNRGRGYRRGRGHGHTRECGRVYYSL